MAYFPNGMSYYYWQENNCHDCVNYRDNGTGSYGCAISDAHFILASEMLDENGLSTLVATTLEHFIPDDGLHAGDCKMRLTAEMIADAKRHDQEQVDLERYLAALADTHPKDGDVKQDPLVSGAVGEAETPKTSQSGSLTND